MVAYAAAEAPTAMPSLVVREQLPGEVAHHYDSGGGDYILSTANRFTVFRGGRESRFEVPLRTSRKLFSSSRVTRRLMRIDKSNAVFNKQRDGVVVLYDGVIYFFDLIRQSLAVAGRLTQCRNVLHGGIAVTDHGIYFGEYGANAARDPVPIWRSKDGGRSFEIVYRFPAGSIRHIHGVYCDPYTDSLWVPTGDFAGECFIAEAKDPDFREVKLHGDGTQKWRTVGLVFEPDRIVWVMDSQLETSHLESFDRSTGALREYRAFPGPVWYCKQMADGVVLLQSTVEIGAGVQSDHAHVFMSDDGSCWHEVAKWRKDPLPMPYFKSGVVAFADGTQTSDDFLVFGEGLRDLDGRILKVGLRRS